MEEHTSSPQGRGRFIVGHGPRHTEALLLADLDVLLEASIEEPRLLADPVIVVVPSRSLRDHLAAAVVRRRGGAVAGLEIVTLYALATTIAARAGTPPPRGGRLFDLLVRRAARGEPVLASALDTLRDGYATVSATARDLLDAGFSPALLDGVLEQIAELARREGWGGAAVRAGALVRVAATAFTEADLLGVEVPGAVFARAVDVLTVDPATVLRARAVLVHGFADATGCATDLLECLVRRCEARVYLDEPPDPACTERSDAGVVFADRFTARLGYVRRPDRTQPGAAPDATLELLRVPGAEIEAREASRRIKRLLDGGTRPEAILIVARQLGPYVVPLRLHLRRLGVPFSGVDAQAPGGAARRRIAALTAILDDGNAVSVDRWLDAALSLPVDLDRATRGVAGASAGKAPDLDLRLALRALGAGRLDDVAAIEPAAVLFGSSYPLPLRRGWEEGDGEEVSGPRLHRRTLPGAVLEAAVGAASRLRALLRSWPERAPAEDHLRRARVLLAEHLGWHAAGVDVGPAFEALAAITAAVPAELPLDRDELSILLRRELEGRGLSPLGGRGGGVRVLSVVEARGVTCEHLFLLGLNRESFPRPVHEDPLLPDAFRAAMRAVLPDLPIKATGHDEERYLFAQLLSAAEHVTVSWQSVDDDGRPAPPSPLVERLRLEAGLKEPRVVASLYAPPETDNPPGPRPAHEHAVLAGLYGRRSDLAVALALAIGTDAAESLARARLATLDELDPDVSTAEGRRRRAALGPYFGFIGPAAGDDDPRRQDLPVTTLEGIAVCSWQAFLRRLLRLEPPPDPLATLPGIDALLLGNTVHAILQRIAATPWGGTTPSIAEVALRVPAPAPWPEPAALDDLLRDEAVRRAREYGAPWLAAPLAARALPYLELARALEWERGNPPVVGVEVSGALTVAVGEGVERSVTFRADRVDRDETGLRLTDYKTGSPISVDKQQRTRDRKLREAVSCGERLQAVAYALGAAPATGRYLFLKKPREEWDRGIREVTVGADDVPLAEAFTNVASTALAAWGEGALLPRLLDAKLAEAPRACNSCEVKSACLQLDSVARQRLARWVEKRRKAGGVRGLDRAQASAWRVWALREGATP